MAALPQCDAFGFIYDQAGDPAADILVTLKRVIDASGNPILLAPLTTLTDSAGSFHFTLPEDATAFISARASALWNCPTGRAFKVPPGPTGELITTFLMPESSSVVPPLVYVSDTLSLPRSSATADGYLAAADYVRFDAATDVTGGVSSFAARTGDIVPLSAHYQAFYLRLVGGALTGPLTLAADPTMPMQAATMQYVLAQLASATAGVASFNSRTGVVVPISGDYASFYAPVTHAHTRSQITDLGVFSTSAPGLVPQPTSGDAAKVLSGAGTWVDAPTGSTAPTMPATWYVTDYKASGSKLQLTGTISSGSSTLTITAGTPDFVVGQGIYIKGGGSGGTVPLITKVTAVSGTTITVQNPALANVTAVANNVQHDDSAAINAALQAVVDAGGGTLNFAPGFYRVNGTILSTNSIIKLPYNATTNPSIAVSLIGQPQPGMCFSTGGVGPAQHGVIIQTDVINTGACIFAAALYSDTLVDLTWFNNITLFMDGFTFRTYDNPQIHGLDLGGCDNICIRNIQIDAGVPFLTASQPTATVFGLRTPAVSAGMANHYAENVAIYNYGIGLVFSEMLRANLIQVFRCKVGMSASPSYYPARFYSSLIWHCPTGVDIQNPITLDMSLDIEFNASAGWDAPIAGHDIYDPDNLLTGAIKVLKVANDGIGTKGTLSNTGCVNCTIQDLGTGDIASLEITNNFKANNISIGGNLTFGGHVVSVGANESADAAGYRELQVPNGVAGTGLLANLLSYWKFDETAPSSNRVDSALGGINTLIPATAIPITTGKSGFVNCLVFNGDGKRLTAASNSGLSMGAGVDYTIAAWVQIADKTIDRDYLSKAGSGSDEYILGYKQSTAIDRFRFSIKGPTAYHEVVSTPAGSPAINTWYLVIVEHDATAATISIQVNNGTINTMPQGEPPITGTDPLVIACYGDGAANFWNGLVDEVAIWKNQKLSTGLRSTLWAGGAGLPFASW